MSHRSLRAPALALFAVLILAVPVFAKVLDGTDGPDILIGTKRGDQITGKGGQDLLQGKGGNDTYFFDEGWGQDTAIIETRRGGKDTVDFSALESSVLVVIVREFDQFDIFRDNNSGSDDLVGLDPEAGIPYIETVIGGQGDGDAITTGGGPQTLNPGGGGTDILVDEGGYDDGAGFEIPASNDTYVGFGSNTGTDTIRDWGGTDVVDLRPTSSSSVTMTAIDSDGSNGTKESLQIALNFDPNHKVVINGHFGPFDPLSSQSGMDGHIEKLIFADVTYTDKHPPEVEGALSTEETRGKRTEMPESDTLAAAEGNGDEEVEAGPDVAPDTHQDKAAKEKKTKEATKSKKAKR